MKKNLSLLNPNNEVLSSYVDEELSKKFKEAKKKKIGIEDFIQDFINQFVSPETKKAYIKDLYFFFHFLRSGSVFIKEPKEIEGHHFQFYRDELIKKGYSSATINRRLVAIRSFIKWAMAIKLIDYNPLDVVKLPKVQTESPTLAFSDAEVLKMIDAPDLKTKMGHVHKMAMILLFGLGLRRSELVNIKLHDFYQDRNHFVIKIKGKGDKERHLPLHPNIVRELQNYISALRDFGTHLEADDYLLQNNKSEKNLKPIDGSTVYRIIEKYAKSVGINKKVSPHSCRATAISHLLDTQKTPIRDVAIFAGHSKITTTERYDKRRESLDHSAAYEVDYKIKKSS